MITPQDLLIVLAITEEGSVSAAAERLTTSQPALSRSLGELERRVGAKLFDRLPRGMAPTPAGEALASHGRAVMAVTERSQRELDTRIATGATELLIGIVPQISVVPVSRALAALHQVDPGLRIRARIGTHADILPELRRGELDVMVGPSPLDLDFVSTPLFEERPVLLVRRNHPVLLGGRSDDLPALREYPWVMPPAGDLALTRVESLYRDQGLDPPSAAVSTVDVPLTVNMAMESDFVAVVPQDVALLAVGAGRAVALPIELPGPKSLVWALQRRDMPARPQVQRFLHALAAELGKLGLDPAPVG